MITNVIFISQKQAPAHRFITYQFQQTRACFGLLRFDQHSSTATMPSWTLPLITV